MTCYGFQHPRIGTSSRLEKEKFHIDSEQGSRLHMQLVIQGPPGFMLEIPRIQDAITESKSSVSKMRMCRFNFNYDSQ